MNTQAKVAMHKKIHPHRYCPVRQCLWRVVKLDHASQTFQPDPACPGGYCPRHQHLRPKEAR